MWAKHFLRVARSNGWNTHVERIANAAVVLEGEAEMWYNSRAVYWEANARTWGEFEQAFVARFRAPGYLEQLEAALHDPKQGSDEAVASYAERYRCLHAERDAIGGAFPIDALRRYWIMGLTAKLKLDVLKAEPADFDTAVVEATRVERATLLME